MKIKLIMILCLLTIVLTACRASGQEALQPSIKPTPTQEPERITTPTAEPTSPPNQDSSAEEADFRSINWGMSIAEVEEAEGEANFAVSDSLVYDDLSVAGIDVVLVYYFNESDQLYSAIYKSAETHTNKNDFIDDYKKVVEALTEKYGKPLDSGTIWKDDLYKDDPTDWGMAVSAGHMIMYAKWETENTDIMIALTGDNFEISTMIGYESKMIPSKKDDITEGL